MVTEHVYGEDGRLLRTVSRQEAEWDDEQRRWALALRQYEDGKCPGCGDQFAETSDPASENMWVVDDPHRCHKCTALSDAVERRQRQYEDAPRAPHALHYHVSRRKP